MAVGGLAISAERADQIEADIIAIRNAHNTDGEIKWANAKSRKDNVHKAYIDFLFGLLKIGHAHFHVRIAPFKQYDHKTSGPRRETDTISRAFYQLLLHRAGRFYGQSCKIMVRPDNGECTSELNANMGALNYEIQKRLRISRPPIVDISPRNSKTTPLLQLLDVSLGAISSYANGALDNPSIGPVKTELSRYAFSLTGLKSPKDSTHMDDRKFNYWVVKPKGTAPTR